MFVISNLNCSYWSSRTKLCSVFIWRWFHWRILVIWWFNWRIFVICWLLLRAVERSRPQAQAGQGEDSQAVPCWEGEVPGVLWVHHHDHCEYSTPAPTDGGENSKKKKKSANRLILDTFRVIILAVSSFI